MRNKNTITLNGTNSTEITGLLIQSLPPVSKPAVRTLVEEIDGRDGDVVTALGYAAYDKEITIGLYGNFEIDQVIEYFASEGTVTFSNEPDKVYSYAIYNQIDFERLIRFRTATVTLHVQPFKYSVDELPKTYNSNQSQSVTIRNNGNVYSRPTMALRGSGIISLSLNGSQLFQITFPDGVAEITIDTNAMEAYSGTLDTLMNRYVDGDYDNFKLNIGANSISWTGDLTSLTIWNYSRWI